MIGNWFRRLTGAQHTVEHLLTDIDDTRQRYQETADVRDLDELTSGYRELLGHPVFSTAQRALRVAASAEASGYFLDSYHAHGNDDDLETAVGLAQNATAETPAESEVRGICVSILGTALRARFERRGAIEDIDQAVGCYEQALEASGHSSPEMPGYMTNLANALWSRYRRLGSWSDLRRAADLHREAAHAFGGSSGRGTALHNYALVLRDMYERSGVLAYLEEATTVVLAAVEDPRLDPRVRVPAVNNAAHVLFTRWDHNRDPAGLDLIIELVTPLLDFVAGPDRAICLDKLGTALAERHHATGEREDVERAVTALEEAARLIPLDHPGWPAQLDNLASALQSRWRTTGSDDDLVHVIGIREALAASGATDRFGRTVFLNNLGRTLIDAKDADTRRVTAVFREACRTGMDSNPGEVLGAAGDWGRWAAGRSSWAEAAEAYDHGLTATRSLFQRQLLRRHKELWVVTAGRFAAEAGHAHVRNGNPELAVQSLERGRSMLLSEALERDPADLADLAEGGHSNLRSRFVRAVDQAHTRD